MLFFNEHIFLPASIKAFNKMTIYLFTAIYFQSFSMCNDVTSYGNLLCPYSHYDTNHASANLSPRFHAIGTEGTLFVTRAADSEL